ncbi:MAG: hypothetical protein WAV72_25905 [Bradyrhizobium sp.]
MPDISPKAIILTLIGVVGLWALTPVVTFLLPFAKMDERGQLGDLFGSINALFSGLAFAGVVFAILLQRQELALQRQELKETRLEMKRTADAQEQAQQALNQTIWAQSFKVALDILEEPKTMRARQTVWTHRDAIHSIHVDLVNEGIMADAQHVARSFEAVGTMVRKGLLPADYIIDTWSVPIARQWMITEPYLDKLRGDRGDPFIGQDFEYLAKAANEFLKDRAVLISM